MEEMKTTIIADLEKYAHELPEKPAVCDKKRQRHIRNCFSELREKQLFYRSMEQDAPIK